MANPEELVPPMGTTDLTSFNTFYNKYNPFSDSEGYAAYKANLPKGVFEKTESEWVDDSFQSQLKDRYSQYLEGGGSANLSFEDFSNNTSTNFLRPDGVNDRVINQNILDSAMGVANKASEAAGGGVLNQNQFTKAVQGGQTVVPGYNTNIGTPNVPVIGAPVSNSLQSSSNSGTIPSIKHNDPSTSTNESLDLIDGSIILGNGETLEQTKEQKDQALNIFGKASKLFGGILSETDLIRMSLYTVGGLMTGGSMGGSFKWAGNQVLKEQAGRQTAQAKLNETKAGMFNKAPKQVRVKGSNDPTQAIYISGDWYDAGTKLKITGKVEDWDKSMSRDGQLPEYMDLITSASTQIKNEDGTEINIGPVSAVIANSWYTQVEDWNRKGYDIELDDPKTRAAFDIAVKRSFQANKDYESGREVAVPSQFYEMTLIQGLSPGADENFKDSNGNYLSADANGEMVKAVDSIIDAGLLEVKNRGKGGTVTLRSVMSQIKKGWSELSEKDKAAYINGAGKGRSGYSKYIVDQSKTLTL